MTINIGLPISLTAAQRIAELMPVRTNLLAWAETFEEHAATGAEKLAQYPLIKFEDICRYHPDGHGHGWEGDIQIPVSLAITMLKAAVTEIDKELTALGVDLESGE